ncbi:nuclear receptor coactivator 7-like isoform X7 [Lineus longissimus]|uniref:nuclear receptor coactivator 7-like isoform X7 n=1 Tax=Lineus longissimus TaxID=88925 RepID=UPI00315D9A13
MASSLKRSFKDRAKEKLGFGSKTKAQSVDTAGLGIMNPLSWDNLSSDIKEKLRGESISAKPDSLPVTDLSPRSSRMELKRSDSQDSNDGLAGNNTENNKKARVIIKPKGTMDYRVKNSDTLPKIAAQFDTTPSELCNLNRLSTRFIFPGQTLFVPDLDYYSSASDDAPASPLASSPPKHKPPDIPCIMQVGSPVKSPPRGPGLAERVSSPIKVQDMSPPQPLSEEEAQKLDRECYERFIKLNVKHITDGQVPLRYSQVQYGSIDQVLEKGVVSGVLLVTPNAIMFDPNVSDPLVIEHGADAYGMIATMDTVISVAMYHDIAAMKLKGGNKDVAEHAQLHKPEVYHSKTCPLAQHSRKRQESQTNDAKPSENVTSENNNKKASVDSEVLEDSDGKRVQTSHDASSVLQAERGSTTDQSGFSCQIDKVGAVADPAQGGVASAIMDDPSERRDGAMKLLDPDEGKLAHVRFRDTTEDINACLEPTGDEVKVGSVESGIAEMEEEDKDKSESSPPPLTPHMQIGNIMYFQYGSVDAEGGEGAEGASEGGAGALEGGAGASEGRVNTQEKMIPIKPFPQEADETAADASETSARTDDTEQADEVTKLKRSDPIPAPLKKPTGNLGKGSFSPLNFSPNFSSFVDFSSGLFSTSKDDRARVKDIAESSMVAPSPEMTSSMEGSLEHTQVTQTGMPGFLFVDMSDRAPGRIVIEWNRNSTWYTKPFQIISDTVSNSMTTSKPDELSAAGKGEKAVIELEVESAVRLEDKPELFQSIDVNSCTCLYSRDSKLIPRPAKQFEDPPLYLCLKVGIPLKGRQSGTCPIEAYSRKRKKPEYWFSIPREKVDHLYAFFIQWSPNLYGGDEIDPKERGFVIIEDDDEVEEDMHVDFVKGRITRSMSKDWEIVHVDEARRRLSILEVEDSLPLPELVGNTVILSEEHVIAITKHLPARAEGYPWTLIYSSDQNGFSLKTLYRAMYDYETPVLLVIKDTCNSVFGALTSCALKWSDHFYGTGETFLYTFYPEFKVFNWSGENNFFIKGNKESLAIGAGQGSFGIWLDGDLYHGRTQRCDTFNNEPLSVQEDFIVKGFEAWGFV